MTHGTGKTEFRVLSFAELCEEVDREKDLQAGLHPSNPEHVDMCRVCEDGTHALIFWGGYEYAVRISEIQDPEDLLWLIVRLSRKTWKHGTLPRVGSLIQMIAAEKGWPQFAKISTRNAAPLPSHNIAKERAKVTPKVRWQAIKRDGYRCRCCGFSVQDGAALHVDHIIPVSAGGSSGMDNLQTLCTACNIGKGAAT